MRKNNSRTQTGPTPDQKRQIVFDIVSRASADEPLTLKGVTTLSDLKMDDVRFYCDRLLEAKQINAKMIPDSFYPQQKVRAFFKKF